MKRARGNLDGELVPWNADKKDVQNEINARTYKAGYTDRDGQPRNGKGDSPRPVNKKLYDANYVRIFGHE